jgi:hypothetical protein|tara:strand:+ start:1260 stop:1889 length:630 start_codon:yes stop_codon:yes gene_type:complete
MRLHKTIILLLISTVVSSSFAYAEYYRWTDENGDTQYGDQVPADAADNGRVRVNESGQVVEQISPAKSSEEQIRDDEQQRISKIERQLKEKQDNYDRVLLTTFNSAEEILQVRDERISLVEQSISISRERLRKQQIELVKLNDSRTRFIDRDMEPPEWIENNENKVLSRMMGIERYISERGLELEKLRKRFGEDLNRYKELTKRSVTSR